MNFKVSALFLFFVLGFTACLVSPQKALEKGRISRSNYSVELPFEMKSRLVILTVEIKGNKYKFLFDTGAPTSISKRIQEKAQFKRVSKGNIRDTDSNRKRVDYVKVDSLFLGDMLYLEETAFVADFDSNPILKCLELDGIIGSNTIRKSNWIIDQKEKMITITNGEIQSQFENSIELGFKPDQQFDMNVSPHLGRSTIYNLKIDYGSNGSLSLPSNVFNKLRDAHAFDSISTMIGQQQSGLFGKAIDFTKQITYSDSLMFGSHYLNKVKIEESSSALIGTKILFQYLVGIDWSKNLVYFKEYDNPNFRVRKSELSFGIDDKGRPKILAVIKNSESYNKGVRSNMNLKSFNGESMIIENSFCNFLNAIDASNDRHELVVLDSTTQEIKVYIDYEK